MEEEKKSRLERLEKKLDEVLEPKRKKDKKKFKLPRKAKLSKGRMKNGYVTVAIVRDNKNVDFEKVKLEDGVYILDGATYHTTDEDSIYFYKGKPIVFQSVKRRNPRNMLEGENETYGDRLIAAKLLSGRLKAKNKFGGIIIWIILAVIAGYLITQGL